MKFNPRELYDKYDYDVSPENFMNNAQYRLDTSQYVDVKQFSSLPEFAIRGINGIVSHNIRSLPRNLEKLLIDINVSCLPISIMAVSVTKLPHEIECLYDIPNYRGFFNSCSALGGGVAIYVSKTIPSRILTDFMKMTTDIETIATIVTIKSRDYVILNVYRPPAGGLSEFIQELINIHQNLISRYTICNVVLVVVG